MLTVSKIIVGGICLVAVSLGLAGCNLPFIAMDPTPNSTEIYQTAAAMMTEQTGLANPGKTQPAETPIPLIITPTLAQSSPAVKTVVLLAPTATMLCDRVKPGIPLDVTVPDDTRLQPGEAFTKIWRFENDGSCAWTKDYAVVWFSGEELGADKSQYFTDPIQPGDSTDINVDMIAPMEPGVYESYWMMRNDKRGLFGLGPNGNAPFWVRIQVVAVNTLTPTPTLIPTATPVVHISGSASLDKSQTFDLDSGKLAQGAEDDLLLRIDDEERTLVPTNNTRLGVFGLLQPGEVDCRGAVLSNEAVDLSKVEVSSYLCYRTNQGLPGSLQITQLSGDGKALIFDFVTWSIP